MTSLTKQQVATVKEKISSDGVTTSELLEELLDHLCTSIEIEMDNGFSFDEALKKAFNELTEGELKLTEMETQEALEGKEIYYPNLYQSVGLIGLMWIGAAFMGFIFRAILVGSGLIAIVPVYILVFPFFVVGSTILLASKWIRQSGNASLFSFRKVPIYVYVILFIISILMTFWVDPLGQFTLASQQSFRVYINALTSLGVSPVLVGFLFTFLSELLIRGIILKGLLKTLTPGKAIFWSSVLSVTLNLYNPLRTLIINLLLGWVYWKTKSLNATLLMISTWLGASILTIYLLGNRNEILITFSWRAWFSNFELYTTLVVFALLLTFGLFYFLNRKLSAAVKH